MTQEELNKLQHIKKEIQLLEQQINDLKFKSYKYDKVKGSDPKFPYTQRSFTIEGYNYEEYYSKLELLIKKLEERKCKEINERNRIEDFIASIDDPKIRNILILKHIKGLTWKQIGKEIGYVERHCKRLYKDFFERMESHKPHA